MYKNLCLLLVLGLLLTGCGKVEQDPDCLLTINETCITKISKTPALDGNYWRGSKDFCGGLKNMPTAVDLARIATYVYDDLPALPADEARKNLKPNEHFKYFDIYKSGNFKILSDETEQADQYAWIRTYYQKETEWTSITSTAGGGTITVCVKH